ncbi:protein HIDE1 isoform X1 [Rhineura floridana]|uniref:protein HIDE1 isoform X1 n=1 Tax=Rhineura floridana TaxID=261503 RepID=UPI002AC7EA7D|nr:protein HIDE1 isoform X1 [Rhineura floridana]
MDLKILFLLAGSLVASSRFPSPLILSNGRVEGESIKITCLAPRHFKDAWFFLFKVNQVQPLQTLPAAETQHSVTFFLENITYGDRGQYKCQYGMYNGSELKLSELSHILEITVEASGLTTSPPTSPPRSDSKGPVWVLPSVLSVAGVLLLVVIFVVAVTAIRRFKDRRKKKRELQSCWTETSYPTTETSFDNCVFTVTMKMDLEVIENYGARTSSAMNTRLASNCSVEKPDFCTFRSSE